MNVELKKNKAAIISRQGLGDGLIMMIAAFNLKLKGFEVTFYHRLFQELKDFFPGYKFKEQPDGLSELSEFDIIIVEHYFSDIINQLISQRDKIKAAFQVIYPSFKKKYFPALHTFDYICDKNKSMNENIQKAVSIILGLPSGLKTNGITVPSILSYRKYSKRIVLHPTSNEKDKNWKKDKFVKIYHLLKKEGFFPIFSLAPHEAEDWKGENLSFITFKDFHELASFIYESGYLIGNDSGPAHLSSNLNIPTIVIASNPHKMKLWKPDFKKVSLITAPLLIPNIKHFRLRNKYWSYFISTQRVMKEFKIFAAST